MNACFIVHWLIRLSFLEKIMWLDRHRYGNIHTYTRYIKKIKNIILKS